MALDAGKVVGTLELQDQWNTTLEKAAANTNTFAATAQASMTRASAATAQLGTTTLSLESRYAVTQATARVLDRNIAALTDDIVKSGAATAAQKSQLDTLTATLTRVQAAAAGFQRELATTGTTASTASEAFRTANQLLGLFGVGLSAAAAINFTKGLIDSAGALVDLNAKTGVSLEQLQRWTFVGVQAGVTTDQFADAAFKLGIKLAGGSGSVHAAVEKLGLSYAELRAQSPEAQFNTIIAALEGMESPQERNRLAVELFGKSFAAIAPAVASGYTEMAKQAAVSSDAQIKAIDRAADRWDAFYANQKTRLTAHLGDAVSRWEVFANLTYTQQAKLVANAALGSIAFSAALDVYVKAAKRLAAAHDIELPPAVVAATANYTIELVKAQVAVNHLTRDQIAQVEAGKALGKTTDEIINDMGITEGMLKVITQRQEDRKKATTAAAEETKKAAAIEAAALLQTTKLWDEYFKLRVEHGGTANQIAIAQIDQWAADVTAQAQKAGTDTRQFYDALAANSREKMASVGIDWDLWKTKSIPALREARDNALTTYNAMVVSGKFFREDLDKQLAKYHELQDAARGYGKESVAAQDAARKATEKQNAALEAQKKAEEAAAKAAANRALGGSAEVTSANFDEAIRNLVTTGGRNPTGTGSTLSEAQAYELARQGYSLQEILQYAGSTGPVPPPRGPRIPGFAWGGAGDFGSGTLAMLHGPEAIVPLPAASGGSIARGGGAQPPANIHIDARNSFFTDKRQLGELGRIVDAALVEHGRSLGKSV